MDQRLEYNQTMTNRRIKINLALVTVSFLLQMSAYSSLEGLQSSLNNEDGVHSLSAVYCTFLVASFILPAVAMDFLGSRKATAVGMLSYVPYTLANIFPKPYTLIPTGIILGAGACVQYSAGRVYVSDLAAAYARQTDADEGKTTSHFFGIFLSVAASSTLLGNAVSSVVLQFFGVVHPSTLTTHNTTSIYNATISATVAYKLDEEDSLKCGIHDCDAPQNLSATDFGDGGDSSVDPVVLYVLFGGFAAIQILAAVILFIFTDDAPISRQSPNKNKTSTPETVQLRNKEADQDTRVVEIENERQHYGYRRILRQVLSTGKFLIKNRSAQLLILITIHIGMIHSFVLGKYNKHWVTCSLGLEYVGYVTSAYGLGDVIGSYAGGILSQFVHRWVIMMATLLLEIALGVFLLTWEPETNDGLWIFMVVSALVGIARAFQKIVINTVYSLFFPDDKAAASAAFYIWKPLGSALAYVINSEICSRTFVIFLLALAGIGTILYFITERQYAIKVKRDDLQ